MAAVDGRLAPVLPVSFSLAIVTGEFREGESDVRLSAARSLDYRALRLSYSGDSKLQCDDGHSRP